MTEIQILKDSLEGFREIMNREETLVEDDTPITWDDLMVIFLDSLVRQKRDAKASLGFLGDVGPEEPQEVLEDTPEPLPEPEGTLFRDLPDSWCPSCEEVNFSQVSGCDKCGTARVLLGSEKLESEIRGLELIIINLQKEIVYLQSHGC
tara:strand:+ start:101 stop:547 length:447 start_codon:yes stop_codon:yes gene_type:complete